MNRTELIQNIKSGFATEVVPSVCFHAFSDAVIYLSGTIPTNLILTDLVHATMRSTVSLTAQQILEFCLLNFYGRNGRQIKFSTRLKIRGSTAAFAIIIGKFIVPSRRNFATLFIQPIICATGSVLLVCLMNLKETSEMLREVVPNEYQVIDNVINENRIPERAQMVENTLNQFFGN